MSKNNTQRDSFITRAIAAIAPSFAVQRKTAQIQLASLRSYEAAGKGRNNSGWFAPDVSGNEALRYDLPTLRDRSRSLVRNSPYGEKIVSTLSAQIVASGIKPRIPKKYEKLAALWNDFVRNADYEGDTNLYGLQLLATRTMIESGEALIIKRPAKTNDGLSIPLQYQVLEPDFIDSNKNGETDSGNKIIQGIEVDKTGRRVAFWLYKEHPGDYMNTLAMKSQRIPAQDVIHLYEAKRPGTKRGVPWLTPAMTKMKNLDDFDDAELLAKKIQACHVMSIESSLEDAGTNIGKVTRKNDGEKRQAIKAGAILYPKAGEQAKMHSPNISVGYPEYSRKHLHDIAAAVRMTYESVTSDLSQVNFSSHKAGTLITRQWIDQLRELLYVPRMCHPIWLEFLRYAKAKHGVEAPETIAWSFPKWPSLDPSKDVKADRDAVRAGFKSLQDVILDTGADPDVTFTSIKETNERLDRDNIVLDSDPRHSTQAGVKQKDDNDGGETND